MIAAITVLIVATIYALSKTLKATRQQQLMPPHPNILSAHEMECIRIA
jgi:hypothetical protein